MKMYTLALAIGCATTLVTGAKANCFTTCGSIRTKNEPALVVLIDFETDPVRCHNQRWHYGAYRLRAEPF